MEKYSSIIGVLVEKTGLQGSQLGNSMKTIITRTTSASKTSDIDEETLSNADESLKSIGINVRDTNGEFQDFDKTMESLAKKWDSLNSVQKSNLSYNLAGTRQVSILKSLVKNWQEVEEISQKAGDSEGVTLENQEKYAESLNGRLGELKATLESIYNGILKSVSIKTLVSAGGSLLTILDKSISKFGLLANVVAGIGLTKAFSGKGLLQTNKVVDEATGRAKNVWSMNGRSLSAMGGSISAGWQQGTSFGSKLKGAISGGVSGYQFSENDVKNIQSYVKELNNGVLAQEAYSKTMAGASTNAKVFVTNNKDNIKALEGVTASTQKTVSATIAQTAADIGATIARTALNAAITMGISALVSLAATGITAIVNYQSNLKQKAEEATTAIKEQNDITAEHQKTLSSIKDEYISLSKGVDSLGQNISLTSDEYERHNELANQIAEMVPSLVTGYTAEGDAILACRDNLKALNDEVKQVSMGEANKVISEKGKDVEKAWENTSKNDWKNSFGIIQEDSASLQDRVDMLNKLENSMSDFETFQKEYSSEYYKWKKSGSDHDKGLNRLLHYNVGDADKLTRESFEEFKTKLISVSVSRKAELEEALSGQKEYLRAGLNANSDYYDLSGDTKAIANSFVNGLTDDIADAWKDKGGMLGYSNKIVDLLKNSDTSKVASELFKLKDQDLPIDEMKEKVDSYINELADYLGQDANQLKISLGFENIDTLQTRLNNIINDITSKYNIDDENTKSLFDGAVKDKVNSSLNANSINTEDELSSWKKIYDTLEDIPNVIERIDTATTQYMSKKNAENPLSFLDNTDIGQRISAMKSQWEDGKSSYMDYFKGLQKEIENIDFSNYTDSLENANELNKKFFTGGVQDLSSELGDLFQNFKDGKVSVSEYLDGYTSAAKTLSAFTDNLQENSKGWYENQEAMDSNTSGTLDNIQEGLSSSIEQVNNFKDSCSAMSAIMSGELDQSSDEMTAYIQVVASDLEWAANNNGYMSEEIKTRLGEQTSEIAANLTNDVANQQFAAQAIAGNTNTAIANMATSVGQLFEVLGNEIANFKVELDVKAEKIGGGTLLGGIFGGEMPSYKITAQAAEGSSTQGSMQALGSSIKAFGDSIVQNIQSQQVSLSDFSKKSSNGYTPSKTTTGNYDNALKNVQDKKNGGSKDDREDKKQQALDEYNKKLEETNEKLAELDDKEHLQNLKNTIDECSLAVEKFDSDIDILDLKLDFLDETDYANRADTVAQKLDILTQKGSQLKSEFADLSEQMNQTTNADQAEAIASRMETIGDALRSNLKDWVESTKDLEKERVGAIADKLTHIDTDSISEARKAYETEMSALDHNIKAVKGETLFSDVQWFSGIMPSKSDKNKTDAEKQADAHEEQIVELQEYEDRVQEIKEQSLALQEEKNQEAIDEERQNLLDSLEEAKTALEDTLADVANSMNSVNDSASNAGSTGSNAMNSIGNSASSAGAEVSALSQKLQQLAIDGANSFDKATATIQKWQQTSQTIPSVSTGNLDYNKRIAQFEHLGQRAKGGIVQPNETTLVNEQGQEGAILPNGKFMLLGSGSAQLIDLPIGTKVIPADETAEILKYTGNIDGTVIPKLADGNVGDVNVVAPDIQGEQNATEAYIQLKLQEIKYLQELSSLLENLNRTDWSSLDKFSTSDTNLNTSSTTATSNVSQQTNISTSSNAVNNFVKTTSSAIQTGLNTDNVSIDKLKKNIESQLNDKTFYNTLSKSINSDTTEAFDNIKTDTEDNFLDSILGDPDTVINSYLSSISDWNKIPKEVQAQLGDMGATEDNWSKWIGDPENALQAIPLLETGEAGSWDYLSDEAISILTNMGISSKQTWDNIIANNPLQSFNLLDATWQQMMNSTQGFMSETHKVVLDGIAAIQSLEVVAPQISVPSFDNLKSLIASKIQDILNAINATFSENAVDLNFNVNFEMGTSQNNVSPGSGAAGSGNVPLYLQGNYQEPYGDHGTIATSGCGPTSMAMVLSALTGRSIEPTETAQWSSSHGYRVSEGTSWGYFGAIASEYGISSQSVATSADSLISTLNSGKIMITSMTPGDFTNNGHFIVLTGVTPDGKIMVNDPNSSEKSNETWDAGRVASQCAAGWAFSAYANGTSYHPGGISLVGDGNLSKGSKAPAPEMVLHNSGSVEIVGTHGAEFRNLQRGDVVIPHKETKKIIGRSGNRNGTAVDGSPMYANGVGNDWSNIRNMFTKKASANDTPSDTTSQNSTITPTGSGSFPKYELTQAQIDEIATVITGETGGSNKEAVYAEASQMVNLNEVSYGKSNTAEALLSTLRGGWYAKASWGRGKTDLASQAVKDVIINGYRTLPRYVVEHDYIGDISYVSPGTKGDRSTWIPHQTVVYQGSSVGGGQYIYYSTPGGEGDPFGYKSGTREIYGDDCYDVNQVASQNSKITKAFNATIEKIKSLLGTFKTETNTAKKGLVGFADGGVIDGNSLSLVGDGQGTHKEEIAVLPDGSMHSVGANGAEVFDFPRGTEIINGEDTHNLKQFIGDVKGKKVKRFATGTKGSMDAQTRVLTEAIKSLIADKLPDEWKDSENETLKNLKADSDYAKKALEDWIKADENKAFKDIDVASWFNEANEFTDTYYEEVEKLKEGLDDAGLEQLHKFTNNAKWYNGLIVDATNGAQEALTDISGNLLDFCEATNMTLTDLVKKVHEEAELSDDQAFATLSEYMSHYNERKAESDKVIDEYLNYFPKMWDKLANSTWLTETIDNMDAILQDPNFGALLDRTTNALKPQLRNLEYQRSQKAQADVVRNDVDFNALLEKYNLKPEYVEQWFDEFGNLSRTYEIDIDNIRSSMHPDDLSSLEYYVNSISWFKKEYSIVNEDILGVLSDVGFSLEGVNGWFNDAGELTWQFTETLNRLHGIVADDVITALWDFANTLSGYKQTYAQDPSTKLAYYQDYQQQMNNGANDIRENEDFLRIINRMLIAQGMSDATSRSVSARKELLNNDGLQVGNINQADRGLIYWSPEEIENQKEALESYYDAFLTDVYDNVDDFINDKILGATSTILDVTGKFDDVDITYTPIVKMPDGSGKLLTQEQLAEYFNTLIGEISVDGIWNIRDLFALDSQGMEIDGVQIQNIIGGIGDTAIDTCNKLYAMGLPLYEYASWRNNAQQVANELGVDLVDFVMGYNSILSTFDDIEQWYSETGEFTDKYYSDIDKLAQTLSESEFTTFQYFTESLSWYKKEYGSVSGMVEALFDEVNAKTQEYQDGLTDPKKVEAERKQRLDEAVQVVRNNQKENLFELYSKEKETTLRKSEVAKSSQTELTSAWDEVYEQWKNAKDSGESKEAIDAYYDKLQEITDALSDNQEYMEDIDKQWQDIIGQINDYYDTLNEYISKKYSVDLTVNDDAISRAELSLGRQDRYGTQVVDLKKVNKLYEERIELIEAQKQAEQDSISNIRTEYDDLYGKFTENEINSWFDLDGNTTNALEDIILLTQDDADLNMRITTFANAMSKNLQTLKDFDDQQQDAMNTIYDNERTLWRAALDDCLQVADEIKNVHDSIVLSLQKEQAIIERQLSMATKAKDQVSVTESLIENKKLQLQESVNSKAEYESQLNQLLRNPAYQQVYEMFDVSKWVDANGELTGYYTQDINNKQVIDDKELYEASQAVGEMMSAWKTGISQQEESIGSLTDSIKSDIDSIYETQSQQAMDALDIVTQIINNRKDKELKARDQVHNKRVEQLQDESDLISKIYNKATSALDDIKSEEDYNKTLSDQQKTADKLQQRIDILSLDNSDSAKMQVLELQKELNDQLDTIAETKRNHEYEQTKKGLSDDLELYNDYMSKIQEAEDKQYQYNQELIEERYSAENVYYEALKALQTGMLQDFEYKGVYTYQQLYDEGNLTAVKLTTAYRKFAKETGQEFENLGASYTNMLGLLEDSGFSYKLLTSDSTDWYVHVNATYSQDDFDYNGQLNVPTANSSNSASNALGAPGNVSNIASDGKEKTYYNDGATSSERALIAKMMANSQAYRNFTDEHDKEFLHANNALMGEDLGATYNDNTGRWYKDGLPLYHSGRISDENKQSYNKINNLLDDEEFAIIKKDETVLTSPVLNDWANNISNMIYGNNLPPIVTNPINEANFPIIPNNNISNVGDTFSVAIDKIQICGDTGNLSKANIESATYDGVLSAIQSVIDKKKS